MKRKQATLSVGNLDAKSGNHMTASEQVILLVEKEFENLPEIDPDNWPYQSPIPSLTKRREDAIGALLRGVVAGREVADEMALRFHDQFEDFSSDPFLLLLEEAIAKFFNLNDPDLAVASEIIQRAAKDGYFERLAEMRASFVSSQVGAA